MAEDEKTYKMTYKVPTLQSDSAESVEHTIDALKMAKKLQFCSDKTLIYSTLTESKRFDLLKSLSNKQREDLDEFCEYLRSCFGADSSGLKQLRRFDEVKQSPKENDIIYFNRVVNLFYSSRSKDRPAVIPLEDQLVIRKQFIEQLNDQKVKSAVISNLSSIPFDDLGKASKRYREGFEVLSSLDSNMKVLAVSDESNRHDRPESGGRREYSQYRATESESVRPELWRQEAVGTMASSGPTRRDTVPKKLSGYWCNYALY